MKQKNKTHLSLNLLKEFEWKFNNRFFRGNEFEKFLKNALNQDKELLYWKAETPKQIKKITYEN